MGVVLRRAVSMAMSYPVSLPIFAAYFLSRNSKALDLFYTIRSMTHGIPIGKGLRLARIKGLWLVYPSREDPNFEDVFLRDVYHAFVPVQDDVVFDVGAHMGFFTTKIAKQVKKVVSFEPDSVNYRFLLANISLNSISNISSMNCAVGKENGFLFLENNYGHGRTKTTDTKTGRKVIVRTIDSLTKELKLTPSLIKIDTEGYESNILFGALSTLSKSKPKLLIAAYHYPNEAREIAEYLTRRGYCCYLYTVPLTLQSDRETYIYAKPVRDCCLR